MLLTPSSCLLSPSAGSRARFPGCLSPQKRPSLGARGGERDEPVDGTLLQHGEWRSGKAAGPGARARTGQHATPKEIWVLFAESCGASDLSSLAQQSQLGP